MRYFLQIVFLLFFSSAYGQKEKQFSVAYNQLKANQKLISKFSFPSSESGRNILLLEIPFADANFISPLLASLAKGKVIEKIQLVYTTFALSPDFDQQKLNQLRLRNLFTLLPDAFSNPLTEWELIGQTGVQNAEDGKKYFHGFVITWRPDASTSLEKAEITTLDSLFLPRIHKGDLITHHSEKDSLKTDLRYIINSDGSKTIININISRDSLWRCFKPDKEDFSVVWAMWIDADHTSIRVTERNFDGYEITRVRKLEELTIDIPSTYTSNIYLNNPDSVVTTVLRRNAWDHIVLVADVTASMSPYTAQVLAWVPIGLADGKCAGFVFFNDGDGKQTNRKEIGKTGGIYSIQTQRFDSVYYMMKKAMNAGDGGDLSENPVEAAIYSLNHFPITSEIILIADNFSAPRDLELFSTINRPVHIVLCGARGTVNPDYLFLARQTHGTIHTVHDDILHLDQMKEGEVVVIEGKHYLLHDEHYICNETFSRY